MFSENTEKSFWTGTFFGVFNQFLLPAVTYGFQTGSLTNALVKKLETSQPAMETKLLNVKLEDRILNTITGQRTRVTDKVQYVTNTKWKWASSSSPSVSATAINKLIILSLLKGRLALRKRKKKKKNTYVAGLEALDTKVSMVVASTVVWGRLFQSWIV